MRRAVRIACGGLLIFIVLELLFRLTNPLGIDYYARAYQYLESCRDTDRGYYVNGGKEANADGLRWYDTNPTQKKRILLLGDSIVYGLGVEFTDTFAYKLQMMLPKHDWINAGVGGWNTENESQWLLWEGLYLEPDLVILFITANDVENVYAGKKTKYPLYQKVIYHSRLLSTVFYIKRNLFRVLWGRTTLKTNVTSDAYAIAEDALINIMAVSPRLMVCLYGDKQTLQTPAMQFYINLLKANHVPMFALPDDLYNRKHYISRIDHHPNRWGHTYIAEAVLLALSKFEAAGWVW